MNLNKSFTNPFLRNRTSNGKFGHATQTNNQNNTTNNEDTVISNILHSIHKSTFMKKVLYNAIGLTLMAASQGFAGDIQGVTGTTVNYIEGTKTYQITTADAQIKNGTAFNGFTKFQLAQGEIANMFYKNGVNNIINFVKDKIDINGVLNTIKSTSGSAADSTGKIGGNLYFLSSKGVVIGKKGVVNTGSFYAIVPNQDFMDKFLGDNGVTFGNDEDVNKILNRRIAGLHSDLKDGTMYNKTEGITLAPGGEIIVEGTINALNGVGLYAGGVVKENNIEKGGLTIKDTAQILTQSQDAFQTIVNTSGVAFTPDVDFISNEAGNIELVSTGNTYDGSTDATLSKYIVGDLNNKGVAEAKITSEGKINSRKDILIKTTANNGDLTSRAVKGRSHTYNNYKGIADLKSTIDIKGGSVEAKGNVAIKAVTNSNVSPLTDNLLNLGLQLTGSMTPININIHPIVIDSKSQIDISGTVTAGTKVSVTADTFSNIVYSDATAKAKIDNKLSNLDGKIPAVAALYVSNDATSIVNINNTIKTTSSEKDDKENYKASVNIKTVVNNNNDASATAKTANDQNPGIAIAVTNIDSNATVNFKENASIDTKGDINLSSELDGWAFTESEGAVGNGSLGAAALTIQSYNTKGEINIESDITPTDNEGDLTIYVNDNVWSSSAYSSTSAGLDEKGQQAANEASQFMSNIVQKLTPDQVGKYITGALGAENEHDFNLAAAITVSTGTHESKINIEGDKKIKVGGDVSINAETSIEDIEVKATSSGETGYKDTAQDKKSYAPAFIISDITHKADVIIKDSDTQGTIEGNTVEIKSIASAPYNRAARLWENVEYEFSILVAYFKTQKPDGYDEMSDEEKANYDAKFSDTADRLESAWNSLKGDFANLSSKNNSEDVTSWEYFKQFCEAIKNAGQLIFPVYEFIKDTIGAGKQAWKVVKELMEFTDYTNYFNIVAISNVSANEEATTTSVAGTFSWTTFDTQSNVLVGRKTEIISTDDSGDDFAVNISSKNDISTITLAGAPIGTDSSYNEGAKTAGGHVMVQKFISDSKVLIAEGASVDSGEGNTAIQASNNAKPTVGALATSKGTKGLDIMVSYLYGDSNAKALVDDETEINAKKAEINTFNNTQATNIAGAVAIGNATGVGIGVAITDLEQNSKAAIQDNDRYWHDNDYDKDGNGESKYDIDSTQSVQMLNVAAKTTGTNNTIAAAGGIMVNDDSGEKGAFTKFCESVGGAIDKLKKPVKAVNDKIKSVKQTIFTKLGFDNLRKITNDRAVPDEEEQQENENANPNFSLEIAGSIGLNFIDNTTEAVIDSANVEADDEDSRVAAEAINSGHNIALAGAAGFMWNKSTKDGAQNQKTVGVNGAAGANSIDNTTTATISNTTITNAKQVDTLAINGGETVAAALGASVTINSGEHQAADGSTGVDIGVSVNDIDNSVTSNMINNTVTGGTNKTNVAATAYESDIQVTGGISMSAGQQANAAGANIDISTINNTLSAKIDGGEYEEVNNVSANALQATTQVNAAIALAVTTKAESQKGFSGAAAYSKLVNTNSATINDATISTIGENGIVTALARDVRGSDDEVKVYEDRLIRDDDQIDFIDKEGKTFYEDLEEIKEIEGDTDKEGNKTVIAEANVEKLSKTSNDRTGQLVVTAAAAGTVSGISVGAGVAIDDIDNTFTSTISNSTITSKEVNSSASNNALLISVAGGVAVSKGDQANLGGGSGSVSWSTIENEANAKILDSNVISNETNVYSSNDAYIISVSGQVTANLGSASAAAAGASVLFNEIENNASSIIQGGTITKNTANSDLLVKSENNAHIIGIALGAAAGKDTSIVVGGTLAINEIENNSEARIGSGTSVLPTELKNLNSVTVKAYDKADIKALSGQVTVSGQFGGGGSIAVNSIDGKTNALVEKTSLGTNKLDVDAESASKIMGLAAGFAISTDEGIALEGAAVTGDIFRDVTAKISDSDADNVNEEINVKANAAEAEVQTIAAVISGSMGQVAVGAGVAVNRIEGDVNATIENSRLKVKNVEVNAKSAQEIITIGAAGAGSNTGVGVAGSFAYNSLGMDTTAAITKTSGFASETYVISENNIGVIAQSDDDIRNYAGIAAVGCEGGVGISLGINMIEGDTKAVVDGVNLTAKAKDSSSKITAKSKVADDKILDSFISTDGIDISYSLSDKRDSEDNTGIVVDSSSTHTLKSLIASIGVGGTAGVSGNVSTNFIDGSTEASVKNASINKGVSANEAGNVTVKASDYANSSGFIGSVAIGGTAGIGLSADANKVTRNTSAKIENINEGSQAKDVNVNAVSKQGISSFVVGVNGSGVVNVGGSVSIGLNSGTTEAAITNAKLTLHFLDVEAKKLTRNHVTAGSAGGSLYGGLNTGVSVANDLSTVKATITGSEIKMSDNGDGDVKVNAENDTKIESLAIAAQGGIGAIAGAISVNYEENKVISEIKNSSIGSNDKRAKDVEITAKDKTTINGYGGGLSGGLVGVGAAVNINSFDGQVTASADNAKIYAENDINIDAHETRDGEQVVAGVGGGIAGIDVHVIKVNAGKMFNQSVDGKSSNALNDAMLTLNNVIKETNDTDNDQGRLTDEEKAKLRANNPKLASEADGKSITSATVRNNSVLDSKHNVKINATADGNIDLLNVNMAGGAVGFVGTVGVINDNKNVSATVSDSAIKIVNSLEVESFANTDSTADLWQGSVGIVGGMGAHSTINMTGNTMTSVSNSNISSNDLNNGVIVSINAKDTSKGHAEAHGLTAGGVAIGNIESNVTNESSTATILDGTNITLPKTKNADRYDSINIRSHKSNEVSAETYTSTNGVIGIGVIESYAKDKGDSAVLIGTNKANTLKADSVFIGSVNNSNSSASMGTTVSIAGVGIGIGLADSLCESTTSTIVKEGNAFDAESASITGIQLNQQNTKVTGNAIGLLEVTSNDSDTKNTSTVNINIGNQNYSEDLSLLVMGVNSSEQQLHTDSTTAGLVSMGYNKADANSDLTTNVSVKGASGNEETKLRDMMVLSGSMASHTVYTNGDGGGIINIDGFAAFSQSHIKETSNTNISGNWNIADEAYISSCNNADTHITAEAWKATIAGYSGTHAKNYIETTSNVNISDNAKINANNVYISSINELNTAGTKENENNAGASGYGGITVNGSYATLEVVSKANVNVGNSATIKAKEGLEIESLTLADLKNKALTKGGAFWGAPIGKTYTDINFNNKVNIGKNAFVATTEKNADINIAATDILTAELTGTADMEGGVGGDAHAMTEYDISKTNEIEISGKISGKRDVGLYTDQTTEGETSIYKLTARADAYNKHSAIALAFASLDGGGTKQTSKVKINEGANVESVRHTYISVTPGIENTQEAASEYTWHGTDDPNSPNNVASTADGSRSTRTVYDNKIIVDGTLTAGFQNKIGIVIGNSNEIVDPSGLYTGNGFVKVPTITYKDNNPVYNNDAYKEYKEQIVVGTMDYANNLFKRYEELVALAHEYQGTLAGLGYEAEITRVVNEMKSYGLYDENKGVIGKLDVPYIELPKMISSGGNVVIDIDDKYGKVSGKGTIEAKGAPEISVENNSNLYMKVNDLTIEDYGGEIVLNSNSLGSSAATKLKDVKTVKTDSSKESIISLKENWDDDITVNVKDDKEQVVAHTFKPVTNIEINGHVKNEAGSVYVENQNGDITVQGKNAKEGASIDAAEIHLTAAKGVIAQGYTEGIVNIGATPEITYKTALQTLEAQVRQEKGTNQDVSNYSVTKGDSGDFSHDKQTPNGTWIAGGAVYINADAINLNGLIQSGYSNYQIILGEEYQAIVDELDSQYGDTTLSDAQIKKYCKLNNGGVKQSTDGKYYYEIQAYYNTNTKEIMLESIDAKGGAIYLTGAIANTSHGNGKIYAADGASDIEIDTTALNYKLSVGNINSGDSKGRVIITDTAKGNIANGGNILAKVTEYTSSGITKYDVTVKGKDENSVSVSNDASNSYTYTPEEGLYYHWTEGTKKTSKYTYYKKTPFYVWGGWPGDDDIKKDLKEHVDPEESPEAQSDKKNGNYIGKENFSDYFRLTYDNEVTSSKETLKKWTTYDDFLHFSGDDHFQLITETGSSQSYHNALKADNPIYIEFISGNAKLVEIKATNDIVLRDSVKANGDQNLYIESVSGSINQTDGKLSAKTFEMYAENGIGNIDNPINFEIQSQNSSLTTETNKGNIAVKATEAFDVSNAQLNVSSKNKNGNVTSIVAESSLTGKVEGKRIDLVSENGSVNMNYSLYTDKLDANDTMSSSLNVTANNDITMTTKGETRLGNVISKDGDVTLNSDKGFVSALPTKLESNEKSEELLVERWKANGIIAEDGKDNTETLKAESKANYEAGINMRFSHYMALKAYYTEHPEVEQSDEYKKLANQFGGFENAEAWLTEQYKDTSSEYYKACNEIYGWSQDQLLYALQKSIINKETGSTKTVKGINVKGKNITLTANNGGVGRNETSEQVDISNLSAPESLDNLKKLARSEASDIRWQVDLNGRTNKNTAVINHTNAIGLEISGDLNIRAKENVYVADASDRGSAINLHSVVSDYGNVRIYGKDGVYTSDNVENENDAVIKTYSGLIIEGGSSSIGTSNKPLVVNVSGEITARSDKDINIKDTTDYMVISALYAGNNANLIANKGITSVYNGIQADELGYLNAKGTITLNTLNGMIGSSPNRPLRVYNNDNKLVINGPDNKSVYINAQGNKGLTISSDSQEGLKTLDIGINSEGKLIFDDDIVCYNNLVLNVDSLAQDSGSALVRYNTNLTSKNGMSLTSSANEFGENLSLVNSNSGDITIKGKANTTLYKGDLSIKHAENSAENGNIEIDIEGASISAKDMSSKGDISVECSNIKAEDTTTNGNLKLKAQKDIGISNVTANGNIDAEAKNQANIKNTRSSGDINVSASNVTLSVVNAGGDITSDAKQTTSIVTSDAGGNITLSSGLDIAATNLEAKGKISFTSENGYVKLGEKSPTFDIIAGNGISISSNNLVFYGDIEAKNGNIDIYTKSSISAIFSKTSMMSNRYRAQYMTARNGDINIKSGGSIELPAVGETNKRFTINSEKGNINITSGRNTNVYSVTAPNGTVTIKSGNNTAITSLQASKALVTTDNNADFGKIVPGTKLTLTKTGGNNKGIFVAAVKSDGSYELVRPDVEGMADFQLKNEVLQGKVITTEKATNNYDNYVENKDRKDIVDETNNAKPSDDQKETNAPSGREQLRNLLKGKTLGK